MAFRAYSRSYGVYLEDTETLEGVAIETKDLKSVIAALQKFVPLEFNTVVYVGIKGQGSHTYNPKCPKDCYGQLEGCMYKKKE